MNCKYTKEILENAIKSSKTWVEVCQNLNVKPRTGNQTHIRKKSIKFGIDTSHFIGKSFNLGRTFLKKDALEYCYNGSNINSDRLKKKLFRDGYKKKKCENCNQEKWLNYDIPLELHHIDGNHINNEFNNIKILCPNCHAIQNIINNTNVAELV